MTKCKLIENALKDPNWDGELNSELCPGKCENCCHKVDDSYPKARTIRKKIWPKHFNEIMTGKKVFEIRLKDFEIEEGDLLILEEWDPETKQYTGRRIGRVVSCVFNTKDIAFWSKQEIEEKGLQIIGFWRNQIE